MAKRHRRNQKREIKKNPHRINREIIREINGSDVKLVSENGEPEIMGINEALKVAENEGKDLVLVGAKAAPPVVKLMDYSKYLYEQNKKKPAQKSKPMKEMRFRPTTDENDLKFKTNHIINFLKKGHKVKAFVFFKGRENRFREQGEKLLLELAVALEDYATVEKMPKMDGRKMNIFFKPKKEEKK
jgi:translation initiation factor IF-3